MNKHKILIDASHPEEVRVALINKRNRLEELDFETSTKQTNKGNIYLAKITRVEPSLQAAFVEYGGNRHGFLPFNEIHPDYFRIPIDDKKALEEEIARANREIDDHDDLPVENVATAKIETEDHPLIVISENPVEENIETEVIQTEDEAITEAPAELRISSEKPVSHEKEKEFAERPSFHKKYKIQEVVQKNQVILIQIDKEERGQKGAAVTSYLSLPGRYCVLMPNTPSSGGVSRKITNTNDRKRLREILTELQLPESMSLIIRTAGMGHSKAEIKRDSEYLFRLWDNIRNKTLTSTAPSIVYEEASLIKRSIRDMYANETEKIIVHGNTGFEEAREFMNELVPNQVSKVEKYTNEGVSLFQNYGVDSQIDELHGHQVSLPSGGTIVIDQTEALVAIDINSGKATRERHIDATAFNTNMEAAEEIARQIKLRDLAGLVVIDFIDMDNSKYIRSVEQKLRDSMASDRARLQIGQISSFGLLELSRQRLRPSLLETSTVACPNCGGKGIVRSTESTSLEILRAIEDRVAHLKQPEVKVKTSMDVAFYILNNKRKQIAALEEKNATKVIIEGDHNLTSAAYEIPTGPKQSAQQKQKKQQPKQQQAQPQQQPQRQNPAQEIIQGETDAATPPPAAQQQPQRTHPGQQRGRRNPRYQRGRRPAHNPQHTGGESTGVVSPMNPTPKEGSTQSKPDEGDGTKSKGRKNSWWKQIFD